MTDDFSDELAAESFEDEVEDDAADEQDESSDESLIDSFDDPFAEYEPTPVEVTDEIYTRFGTEFGDNNAAVLLAAWGDNAVSKDAVVSALLNDTPQISAIYAEHQTESGGLSLEGVSAASQYLLDNSNFKSPEELAQAHPELDHLYFDHADKDGAVSPAGVAIMLAYLAEKSGYKHTRKRRD